VDHAKGVGLYAEYALYGAAVASPAATLVDLISTLEKENPKSQYLDNAYGAYLVALTQTGSSAKVVAIAEKAVANFPENEDLLLVLADAAVSNKQSDRALTYANRLVAARWRTIPSPRMSRQHNESASGAQRWGEDIGSPGSSMASATSMSMPTRTCALPSRSFKATSR
jgi:hypothetical protein